MRINNISKKQNNPYFKARTNFVLNSAQKEEIIKRITNPLCYSLEEVRKLKPGSLGEAYKVSLPGLPALAVKTYTRDDKYRNAEIEAAALEQIPEYCTRTQKLVDVFPINGRNAMISTFVFGYDLGKRFDKMWYAMPFCDFRTPIIICSGIISTLPVS